MSRNIGVGKLYDRLTPEERFRLDVLATARGDLEESERLTRTCQRETYTMNHRGYTGRWTGTYEITLRMYNAVGNELAKLQMVDAFRELIPYSQTLSHNMIFEGYFCGHESGSRYAWGRAGKETASLRDTRRILRSQRRTRTPPQKPTWMASRPRWRSTWGSSRRCWTGWSARSPQTP
jgi:hypothetical protein